MQKPKNHPQLLLKNLRVVLFSEQFAQIAHDFFMWQDGKFAGAGRPGSDGGKVNDRILGGAGINQAVARIENFLPADAKAVEGEQQAFW